MMDSQIKFASVRYLDDESKKIHIVPIEKIQNFEILNKYEDLYFVKRLNTVSKEESLIAAQIMEVGTNEEDLKHNKHRYIFKKLRYSDAVQKILDTEEILHKESPEPETQKETHLYIDENKNEKTNRDAIIFEKYKKMDDEDIINEKLETLNRANKAFEKTQEKLFEIPIALQKENQDLKHENEKLQLEKNRLKNDILLLKKELHTLKTKKQLFPKEKRSASPIITSTPKKKRSETVDTVFNEPSTSQLCEQSPLQKDDLNMHYSEENNNKFHKAKTKKDKEKKARKTKKSKKNKTRNKSKGSDLDYDSDQYIDLTDKENMTTWNDEIYGTIIKMIHLRYGISIPYTTWKEIKKLRRPSLFVRQLSRALWGVHKLMNRAVVLEKSKNRLPDRSPRKPLTPIKKAVLKKCYATFIEMHHKGEKKKFINKWKRYLSIYINFLIETKLKEEKRKRAQSASSNSTSSSSSNSTLNSSDSSSNE